MSLYILCIIHSQIFMHMCLTQCNPIGIQMWYNSFYLRNVCCQECSKEDEVYGPFLLLSFPFTYSEKLLFFWMLLLSKSGIYPGQNVKVHLWCHSRRHLPAFLYSIQKTCVLLILLELSYYKKKKKEGTVSCCVNPQKMII